MKKPPTVPDPAESDDYAQSPEAAEDLAIAKQQARYAMKGAPKGMDFNDLLEVGVDVITNERHGDKTRLHGKDLKNAIKRRLVRAMVRWKERRDPAIIETKDGAAKFIPTEEPGNYSSTVRDPMNREMGMDTATGEKSDVSNWGTRPSVEKKWRRLLESLDGNEQAMILAFLSDWSRARIAEHFEVDQSTVSRLISRLTKEAASLPDDDEEERPPRGGLSFVKPEPAPYVDPRRKPLHPPVADEQKTPRLK